MMNNVDNDEQCGMTMMNNVDNDEQFGMTMLTMTNNVGSKILFNSVILQAHFLRCATMLTAVFIEFHLRTDMQ